MKLFLFVPRQSKRVSTQTVTSAGRTRDLMARLPLLDPRESLPQLHASLYGLNRTSLRITQRLKLLDLHRPPLHLIRGQLESRFSRGAVPLSRSDLPVAGLFRDCCVEMAFGYKIPVLEIARTRRRRQREEMKLSMARALFHLDQTIFACALFRQSPPEGIWQEIHTIYAYARTLGISEDPLKDPATKARTSSSISLTYRRALLFGLSDPFHQSVPLMSRVQEFLRRHALHAQIKNHLRSPRGRCHFAIDLQSDIPARTFGDSETEKLPPNTLFLDTFNLTRDPQKLLKRLQSDEHLDVENSEFKDELGRRLLKEVVDKWGLILTRGEEREHGDRARIDVIIGIEAANYCVNNEMPFVLSTADSIDGKAAPERSRGKGFQPGQSQLKKVKCEVFDRGKSGFRIIAPYDAVDPGSLQVGEVISCREPDLPWITGLIRWVRCVDDSIYFGVEKLARDTRAIVEKPAQKKAP